MQQAKHVKARKSRTGAYIIIVLFLLLAIIGVISVSRNTGENGNLSPAQEEQLEQSLENAPKEGTEAADSTLTATGIEPGALLESGRDINASFYSVYDYDGAVSDLTDTSFSVGKAGMAFDNKGQPILSDVTVFYGEDTEVKTAILYYYEDRYEIYSSSMNDFKKQMEENEFLVSVKIILEDPDATELWAKELTVYSYADLG